MESSNLDPWKRANLEQFNVETLALIPQGQQQEYIALMKELAHAKGIASLVLERVHMFEQERAAFFEPFIAPSVSPIEEILETGLNNTTAPSGAVRAVRIPAEADTPDYTPVTDLNEYRGRHV